MHIRISINFTFLSLFEEHVINHVVKARKICRKQKLNFKLSVSARSLCFPTETGILWIVIAELCEWPISVRFKIRMIMIHWNEYEYTSYPSHIPNIAMHCKKKTKYFCFCFIFYMCESVMNYFDEYILLPPRKLLSFQPMTNIDKRTARDKYLKLFNINLQFIIHITILRNLMKIL